MIPGTSTTLADFLRVAAFSGSRSAYCVILKLPDGRFSMGRYDLTDFEFDLNRGSHNLLVSQITHRGSSEERARLKDVGDASAGVSDIVTKMFAESARAVVERGEDEAKMALEQLRSLGFWFPTELSHELVRAIVGLDGVDRMRTL